MFYKDIKLKLNGSDNFIIRSPILSTLKGRIYLVFFTLRQHNCHWAVDQYLYTKNIDPCQPELLHWHTHILSLKAYRKSVIQSNQFLFNVHAD